MDKSVEFTWLNCVFLFILILKFVNSDEPQAVFTNMIIVVVKPCPAYDEEFHKLLKTKAFQDLNNSFIDIFDLLGNTNNTDEHITTIKQIDQLYSNLSIELEVKFTIRSVKGWIVARLSFTKQLFFIHDFFIHGYMIAYRDGGHSIPLTLLNCTFAFPLNKFIKLLEPVTVDDLDSECDTKLLSYSTLLITVEVLSIILVLLLFASVLIVFWAKKKSQESSNVINQRQSPDVPMRQRLMTYTINESVRS